MPETINYCEEDRGGSPSLLAFMILEGMSLRAKDAEELEDIADGFNKLWDLCGQGDATALEVCLTVNGEEIPFRRTMEMIDAQMERMVEEEANKLIQSRDRGLDDHITALQDVLQEATRSATLLVGDRKDLLHLELGSEILNWAPYTAGGDSLGFVSKGFQRKCRNGEKMGGTLKAPHWTWVDWWAGNKSGQVPVGEDDDGEAMTLAKAIVDFRLGLGDKPEGYE